MIRATTAAEGYFSNPRSEMLALVPASAVTVLEVGCAAGEFSRLLKEQVPSRHITGVEPVAEELAKASPWVDVSLAGVLDDVDFAPASFDVAIVNDVLEHMVDPWSALDKMLTALVPGGALIGSVPTIRSLSVLRPLLLQGTFTYAPKGVLDRTHLRWFTRSSLIAALRQAGFLEPTLTPVRRVPGRVAQLASRFSDEFGVMQYGFVARKP